MRILSLKLKCILCFLSSHFSLFVYTAQFTSCTAQDILILERIGNRLRNQNK